MNSGEKEEKLRFRNITDWLLEWLIAAESFWFVILICDVSKQKNGNSRWSAKNSHSPSKTSFSLPPRGWKMSLRPWPWPRNRHEGLALAILITPLEVFSVCSFSASRIRSERRVETVIFFNEVFLLYLCLDEAFIFLSCHTFWVNSPIVYELCFFCLLLIWTMKIFRCSFFSFSAAAAQHSLDSLTQTVFFLLLWLSGLLARDILLLLLFFFLWAYILIWLPQKKKSVEFHVNFSFHQHPSRSSCCSLTARRSCSGYVGQLR